MDIRLNIHRDPEEVLWEYAEQSDRFRKFSQYVPDQYNKQAVAKNEETKVTEIQPVKISVPKIEKAKTPAKAATEQVVKVSELQAVQTSVKIQEEPAPQPKTKAAKTSKTNKPTPMDIIIQLSENSPVNADYIKQSLIDFISKPTFQKGFGVKKCSEIMQAISSNKFNKSMALFLSFLFDVVFVYLNKDVCYYSEGINEKQKISI